MSDRVIGPIVHNVVALATFAFVDDRGYDLELSLSQVRAHLLRLAYELGGSMDVSMLPSLTLKFNDPKAGGSFAVSLFPSSHTLSLKGASEYVTLRSALACVRAHFAACGCPVRFRALHVKNIFSKVIFPGRIDMDAVAQNPLLMPTYDPTLIGQATYRAPGNGPTVLIWPSGRLVMMGGQCQRQTAVCDFIEDELIDLLLPHLVPIPAPD